MQFTIKDAVLMLNNQTKSTLTVWCRVSWLDPLRIRKSFLESGCCQMKLKHHNT